MNYEYRVCWIHANVDYSQDEEPFDSNYWQDEDGALDEASKWAERWPPATIIWMDRRQVTEWESI